MKINLVKMIIKNLLLEMFEQSNRFSEMPVFCFSKIYVTNLDIVSITYIFFKKNNFFSTKSLIANCLK